MRKKKHTNDLLFLLILLLQSILIAIIIFIQIPKIEAKFQERIKVIDRKMTEQVEFLKKSYIIKSFKAERIKVTTKKIEPLKSKNIKNVLNYNDPVYFGQSTPWYILSAIHNEEHGRLSVGCRYGTSGETGCTQTMPSTRKHYCSDLPPFIIENDIECASRILNANYYTHGKNWWWTCKSYNCGNNDFPVCDKYANRVMKEANRIKNL